MPKGPIAPEELPLSAALREFAEETGIIPAANFFRSAKRQQGGKIVHGWAVQGDWDTADLKSNTFEMEWPPCSGGCNHFPRLIASPGLTLPTRG